MGCDTKAYKKHVDMALAECWANIKITSVQHLCLLGFDIDENVTGLSGHSTDRHDVMILRSPSLANHVATVYF